MAEDTETIEQYMMDTEFTIPVDLKGTGKGSKTIKVTYEFNDEIAEKIDRGEEVEVDDTENLIVDPDRQGEMVPGKKKVKGFLSLNKQLTILVKKINGQDIDGETFWKKTVYKYRDAILTAILDDVYPKRKT